MPNIEDILTLTKSAGKILKDYFGKENQVIKKGEIDLVTEADKKIEKFLVKEIRENFSNHTIVAEEMGGMEGDPNYKWYIDPIDGTTNFANGLPIFSVSVGYMEYGQMKFGAVFNPVWNEMYSAELGKGARLNNKKISVGSKEKLGDSIIVTGFPYDRFSNPNNNIENFAKFTLKVRGIRRLGSAALDLCFLASGKVDGYWEIYLEPWDLAAGSLIASEAGAVVTKIDGSNEIFSSPCNVLAANPVLYKEMYKILN